jgi:hypothetical protein
MRSVVDRKVVVRSMSVVTEVSKFLPSSYHPKFGNLSDTAYDPVKFQSSLFKETSPPPVEQLVLTIRNLFASRTTRRLSIVPTKKCF